MRVWLAIPLAVAVLGGCVGLDQPACRDEAAGLHTPWVDDSFLRTAARQPWETLVLQHGGEEAEAMVHPDGWEVETEEIATWDGDEAFEEAFDEAFEGSADGGPLPPVPQKQDWKGKKGGPHLEVQPDLAGVPGDFSILRVTPGSGAGGKGGQLQLAYDLGGCEEARAGTITWDLAAPDVGASAQPGQGVQVYTAGFFASNGTLFYTNIEAVDHSEWPRAGWYLWEGGDPLPVYVYDQDRSEEPAYWRPVSSNVPHTGTPADPIVMEHAAEVDKRTGLGYFTTIPGFNEALKGLSSSTTHVALLAPEEAYTRPGYEHHELYGEPIVFYMKVVHVVDLPCPLPVSGSCDVTPAMRSA
jgi:hypothetical protein